MNTTTCDHCRRKFTPELQTEPHLLSGETGYFDCPRCRHRYNIYFLSAQGIAYRRQLSGLHQMLTTNLRPSARQRLLEQAKRVQKRYQAELVDLTAERIEATDDQR